MLSSGNLRRQGLCSHFDSRLLERGGQVHGQGGCHVVQMVLISIEGMLRFSPNQGGIFETEPLAASASLNTTPEQMTSTRHQRLRTNVCSMDINWCQMCQEYIGYLRCRFVLCSFFRTSAPRWSNNSLC